MPPTPNSARQSIVLSAAFRTAFLFWLALADLRTMETVAGLECLP